MFVATAFEAAQRWRIIAADEIVFAFVVAASRRALDPTSGPRRGGLGLRAASVRDMDWPRVRGGDLVL